MAKEQKEPEQPTIKELLEKINRSANLLENDVSLARRASIVSHLGAVASNLDAEVRDRRISARVETDASE